MSGNKEAVLTYVPGNGQEALRNDNGGGRQNGELQYQGGSR